MEGRHGAGMLPGLGLDSRLLPFATAQSQQQSTDPAATTRLAFPAAYRRGELPSPEVEPEDGAAKRASASPWHRMKWTDGMVRLLVMVVYCMGDDDGGGSVAEGDQPAAAAGNKSCSRKAAAAATGSLQLQQQQQKKKGKWRSVSRAMMEKGFFVSPQQCEDKFNDLNKRYKRVNDLLGKGTACRVVENHALLDTMDISPKAKEEARKLLNSKHLFFREMCAYHNAAAGGAGGCGPVAPPPLQDKQDCLHHSLEAARRPRDGGSNTNVDISITSKEDEEDNYNDDCNDIEDDDDDEEEYDEEDNLQQNKNCKDDDEDEDSKGFGGGGTTSTCSATKRRRVSSLGKQQPALSASPPLSLSLCPPPPAASIQQLTWELAALGGRGEEQRQWLKKKALELEENRVGYQSRGLQLERQRFKWLRFSSNKESEMERMKLENDRLRLENDRMLLLLRQKELELLTSGGGGGSVSVQSNGNGLHHQLFEG